jgi:hypothetical protein
MNINKKRHKLLELLSKHRNDVKLKKAKHHALGLSFEDIYNELNCNEDELQLIVAELYTCEEIGYHDTYDIVGLFARNNGLTSFSNKKYKRINNAFVKNSIKDLVQIIIPVLSLIITVLVIINNNSKTSKEIKVIEQKIELLQKQINTVPKKK